MAERVMLFIMVGEDETEGLQEREDDLANLDAELDAVEQGGTGQVASFDDSYGYNYEDSSELTDVDEQPGYDDSEDFTDFGDDDAYSVTGDDEEDDDNFDGDDEDFDNDAEDFDGDDDEPESKLGSMLRYGGADDDEENEDDEEDAEDEDKKKDGEEDEDGNSKNEDGGDGKGKKGDNNQNQKGKNKKPKIDPYDGVIKWRPGQPITVKVLEQVWKEIKKIKKAQPYVKTANKMVKTALNVTGDPKILFKFCRWCDETFGEQTDEIGTLLKLATVFSKRLTWGSLSILKTIFFAEPTEMMFSFGLPSALPIALAKPEVKGVLTTIFTIAVPIINRNARKEDKNKKE